MSSLENTNRPILNNNHDSVVPSNTKETKQKKHVSSPDTLEALKAELQTYKQRENSQNDKIRNLEAEVLALKSSKSKLQNELTVMTQKHKTVVDENNRLQHQLLNRLEKINHSIQGADKKISFINEFCQEQKKEKEKLAWNKTITQTAQLVGGLFQDDPMAELISEVQTLNNTSELLMAEIKSLKGGDFSGPSGSFIKPPTHTHQNKYSVGTQIDVLESILVELRSSLPRATPIDDGPLIGCGSSHIIERKQKPVQKKEEPSLGRMFFEAANKIISNYCDHCKEWGHQTEDCTKRVNLYW